MADVSGAWTGTYWQAGRPTRFEATFVQAENTVSGRILDDGNLGEAQASGHLAGRSITFLKRYLASSPTPIYYDGTLSADSNYMSGGWTIRGFGSGRWEAQRSEDSLTQELQRLQRKDLATPAGLARK
ncbi:hypothetical protein C7271_05715 [filamentous cyanobacterium CCP5]|nr:hypothetical protein C7271_05715 [filamentous cyanobacterium CCP5]